MSFLFQVRKVSQWWYSKKGQVHIQTYLKNHKLMCVCVCVHVCLSMYKCMFLCFYVCFLVGFWFLCVYTCVFDSISLLCVVLKQSSITYCTRYWSRYFQYLYITIPPAFIYLSIYLSWSICLAFSVPIFLHFPPSIMASIING